MNVPQKFGLDWTVCSELITLAIKKKRFNNGFQNFEFLRFDLHSLDQNSERLH